LTGLKTKAGQDRVGVERVVGDGEIETDCFSVDGQVGDIGDDCHRDRLLAHKADTFHPPAEGKETELAFETFHQVDITEAGIVKDGDLRRRGILSSESGFGLGSVLGDGRGRE
jgi:hypothetical protein